MAGADAAEAEEIEVGESVREEGRTFATACTVGVWAVGNGTIRASVCKADEADGGWEEVWDGGVCGGL